MAEGDVVVTAGVLVEAGKGPQIVNHDKVKMGSVQISKKEKEVVNEEQIDEVEEIIH